jgi:hypothetical protein
MDYQEYCYLPKEQYLQCGSMTHRWTLGYQKIEGGAPLRNDGFRRRSTGFKYYLLLPFASILFAASLIWGALVMVSYLGGIRRLFR